MVGDFIKAKFLPPRLSRWTADVAGFRSADVCSYKSRVLDCVRDTADDNVEIRRCRIDEMDSGSGDTEGGEIGKWADIRYRSLEHFSRVHKMSL